MDNDPEAVPSKVFNENPLLIDAEIIKRKNSPISPKVRRVIGYRAIRIGRRALEVAILKAHDAGKTNPDRQDLKDSWGSIRDRANAADKAIEATLHALNRNGKTAQTYRSSLSIVRAGKIRSATLADTLASDRRAKRDALILIAAQKIAAGIARDSERRMLEIIASLPVKSSDNKKNAFVLKLYEGWIFLMGVRPGSSTITDQNPFLIFVEAAWQDWLGEDAIWKTPKEKEKVSFVRALNLAEDATSDAAVNSLVANGPSWL
jgi:hypothetical protein